MRRVIWLVSSTVVICAVLAATPSFSATGGWYLLIPPQSPYDEYSQFLEGIKILDTKPLSQWIHQTSYDSAAECEAVRHSQTIVAQNFYAKTNEDYIKTVGSNKDAALLKHMKWTTEKANADVYALMASQCIKSDDSKLAK